MKSFLLFIIHFLYAPSSLASIEGLKNKAWFLDIFFSDENEKWVALFGFFIASLAIYFFMKPFILFFKARVTLGSRKHKVITSIEGPAGILFAVTFFFFSFYSIGFEGIFNEVLVSVIKVIFGISLVWALYNLSDILVDAFEGFAQKTESDLDDHLVPFVAKILKISIVIIGFLLIIQNLGVNILSLLAGIGIGGLALALAAKDTAANLFGSIMILLDRPFRIGDWIITPSEEGTVESVGFRSTRIRTFYNSVVSIPNSLLANVSIDNMGDRKYRRVNTNLGVEYSTSPKKIEDFCSGIKEIIKSHPRTRKDYFIVSLNEYESSGLSILVYFFFEAKDWSDELKYKEEIFLDILKLAENLGVSFAFPSQSIYFKNELNLQK